MTTRAKLAEAENEINTLGSKAAYYKAHFEECKERLDEAYRALDFWQKYAAGSEATYTKAMRDTTMAAREFVERENKEEADD